MASKYMKYKCPNCDYTDRNQRFSCPQCGSYEQFVPMEDEIDAHNRAVSGVRAKASENARKPLTLGTSQHTTEERFVTGITEFDRVMGGGFTVGSVAVLGAQPGAGKSSLALMIAHAYAQADMLAIYFSGEEKESQIDLRASRFGISHENIKVLHTNSLGEILSIVQDMKPDFFVVDSLQAVSSEDIASDAGSILQSKTSAMALTNLAKELGINALLINQVTKNDDFAGSTAIQHVVDTSLFFESDRDSPLKYLRAYKNRFGSIEEVGIFHHVDSGLEGVSDPSGIFLDNSEPVVGASFSVSSEGIRQIPVEVQALVSLSTMNNPRRRFNGVSQRRGEIICPILDKSLKTGLNGFDVYVSTFGGVTVSDPLADLSIASAIYSSLTNRTTPQKTAFIGEITPVGQVRGMSSVERKISELERMGFERVVVPRTAKVMGKHTIDIQFISSISELDKFYQQKG